MPQAVAKNPTGRNTCAVGHGQLDHLLGIAHGLRDGLFEDDVAVGSVVALGVVDVSAEGEEEGVLEVGAELGFVVAGAVIGFAVLSELCYEVTDGLRRAVLARFRHVLDAVVAG